MYDPLKMVGRVRWVKTTGEGIPEMGEGGVTGVGMEVFQFWSRKTCGSIFFIRKTRII